jgi:hypothetical protein
MNKGLVLGDGQHAMTQMNRPAPQEFALRFTPQMLQAAPTPTASLQPS